MKSTSLLLSAVILTKNEEQNITKCLKSVSFCDEILIIDDYSTDQTVKIARKHKAKVFKHHMNRSFANQRNFGLKKARGMWVLFIDADECVSKDLAKEMLARIKSDKQTNGFYIRRVDVLWNKQMFFGELATFGSFGNGYILRLARKQSGRWQRDIHELWDVTGETSKLADKLFHYPHQTYSEFLQDIGERTRIHADTIALEGKRVSTYKAIIWPLGKFFYNYIYKLGFLDGERGFILAMTMSFHSFISWSYLCLTKYQKK